MNDENETPMQQDIDDTLDFDDTDALRYVSKIPRVLRPCRSIVRLTILQKMTSSRYL
ncbi:hypothetical protein IPF89_04715 [Candidatus Saccharibacteria bacterium]|nr:MAG: hypothetical protein IPF89_04715 [Candidatus Saccharibacteria bacterium]